MWFQEYFDLDFVEIYNSSRKVFSKKRNLIYFSAIMLILFGLFSIIPALVSPHITISSQFRLYSHFDYVFMLILSIIVSLNIVMNLHDIKSNSKAGKVAGMSSIGGFAALIGTATCPSCLISIFGFMGVGTLFFMVKYRLLISGIAILVMLLALNYTSKKVAGKCKRCNVPKKDL